MRRWAWLLLAACAAPERDETAHVLLRQADELAFLADWEGAHRLLLQAALDAPRDPEVQLRLARLELEAFGDPARAEARYLDAPRARGLHGLGRCALWRGDEERAIELFEASLREEPTAECARDLALRLLGRGENAGEALDLVERISGGTLRSRLLLAAAGRAPRPARLPEDWTYGLERARLLDPAEARAEVEAYLDKACAGPPARERMARVLAGDPALRRNPRPPAEVK